ncbi:MAG TPA: U32 family peptidase [Bacteroidales bacterium]|nr:U32 family peptidase [Bacteroidales bacterium]
MGLRREEIDLMAPAGSFESLLAAIQGGADSVYFGIGKLNMRARSSFNFTAADLKKIMRICRKYGKKAYLTLNVVFYNEELEEMKRTIDLAGQHGVQAVIASDQAAIHYAHQQGMEVHLSTQVNISNWESLQFYAAFADVAVLARELSLDQVASLTRQIEKDQIRGPSGQLMRVELFAHGALCMSISGKCYLSLHHYNHSANRGECLQDCRKSYTVKEKETGFELDIDNEFIMSPKDLCTIHFVNKILDAGVRVMKIEGRARSPEYVKVVTGCYDQAIRSCLDGSYDAEKIEKWKMRLSSVFNRGFWDGYYLGQKLGEWNDVYGSKALLRKVYIAKNLNYFRQIGVAEFLCESDSLQVGDMILIMGPSTGVIEHVVDEIRVDLDRVEKAHPGQRFSISVPEKVRRADKLYKLIKNP